MFEDVIKLLSLESKDLNIEHYNQYSIASIFLLLVAFNVPSFMLLERHESIGYYIESVSGLLYPWVLIATLGPIIFRYWYSWKCNINYPLVVFIKFIWIYLISVLLIFIPIKLIEFILGDFSILDPVLYMILYMNFTARIFGSINDSNVKNIMVSRFVFFWFPLLLIFPGGFIIMLILF
jgi:hypothetical protein